MNTGLPRYCKKGIPVPRVLFVPQSLPEPQKFRARVHVCMAILQNLQKFRVRVRKTYRTSRSSGYLRHRWACTTQISPERVDNTCCTRTAGVAVATGVQNFQKFRVRVTVLVGGIKLIRLATCKRSTNSLLTHTKPYYNTPPPLKRRDTRSAGYAGGCVNIQAVSFPGDTGESIF